MEIGEVKLFQRNQLWTALLVSFGILIHTRSIDVVADQQQAQPLCTTFRSLPSHRELVCATTCQQLTKVPDNIVNRGIVSVVLPRVTCCRWMYPVATWRRSASTMIRVRRMGDWTRLKLWLTRPWVHRYTIICRLDFSTIVVSMLRTAVGVAEKAHQSKEANDTHNEADFCSN